MIVLILCLCYAAAGASGRAGSGYSISRDQVCHALGVRASDCPDAVEILGHPAALRPQVTLHATRTTAIPFGQQVTVRCDGSACLPFVVLMHQPYAPQLSASERRARSLPPFAIRPGDLAELVQTADGIRLTRRVICVERGRVGDVIRVRDPQGKQIIRAAIVGPGQLIAAF